MTKDEWKEYHRKKQYEYYLRNKEKMDKYSRDYYYSHHEEELKKRKEYRDKRKSIPKTDEQIQKLKEYRHKYYLDHKEKLLFQSKVRRCRIGDTV